MTKEQMEAVREKIIGALRTAGFENPEGLDFEPGQGLPIAFGDEEGNEFTLELNIA